MSGERLRLARKQAGYSLRDLATLLNDLVTPQALGRYERNEIRPSPSVLTALAQALAVTEDFLTAASGVEFGRLEFRKHSGTTAQERSLVEAAVLDRVERYIVVEELLGLDSATWRAPFVPRPVNTLADAEEAALDVRHHWRLGLDPIPNLTELLEQQGIKVILITLPDKVSGLTCIVQRAGEARAVPVIVVNGAHGLERRRMTMAHELAHRLLAPVSDMDEEKAANRFASAFLQPAEHLRDEVGRHRQGFGVPELMHTKRLYRVSAAAMLVRFRDLGIITNETMVYIFQTVGRTWRKTEPEPIETNETGRLELPRRYERLCYRALAERLMDDQRAADLLSEDVSVIRQAMRGSHTGRVTTS